MFVLVFRSCLAIFCSSFFLVQAKLVLVLQKSWCPLPYTFLPPGKLTQHLLCSVPIFFVCLYRSEVRDFALGSWHTLVLMEDGSVYAFGAGSQGQLGVGTRVTKTGLRALTPKRSRSRQWPVWQVTPSECGFQTTPSLRRWRPVRCTALPLRATGSCFCGARFPRHVSSAACRHCGRMRLIDQLLTVAPLQPSVNRWSNRHWCANWRRWWWLVWRVEPTTRCL